MFYLIGLSVLILIISGVFAYTSYYLEDYVATTVFLLVGVLIIILTTWACFRLHEINLEEQRIQNRLVENVIYVTPLNKGLDLL